MGNLTSYFQNKKILITGGTGSLGQVALKKLLEFEPGVVRVLSRDETKQFILAEQYREHNRKHNNIRFFIGNVRDRERMMRAVEDVDIIFHIAALKHVGSCEYNPFEAVKTNVVGTQNVIDAALAEEVEKVISTSSDKATNPCNTMGTTKLMAERLIAAANYHKGSRKTILSAVRFGNVIGTRGSVIPLFISQIKSGGPVTLTEPGMTRFMMSKDEAINLIFQACVYAKGGEIFVLKMPIVRIEDMIEVLIEEYAPQFGYRVDEIGIEVTGKRAGEKMYEELITEEEAERTLELDNMFVVNPQIGAHSKNGTKFTEGHYTSDQKGISKVEIRELLESAGVL